MKAERNRNYGRIHYFLAPNRVIWHGPYCPNDNVHWKILGKDYVESSDLPDNSIEVDPFWVTTQLELGNLHHF